MFDPIAIVGQDCVLPGANSPDELWQLIRERRSSISPVPKGRWRASSERMLSTGACASDAGGFVEGFDFESCLFRVARRALQNAAIEPGDEGKQRIGAIVGNLAYPTEAFVDLAQAVYLPGTVVRQRPARSRFSAGLPVHLLCRELNLRAGGFAIDAACASSLYAIKLACDWLHTDRADMMLAGGINLVESLLIHSGFTALRALSPTGQSRPFHRDADGLVPAEGAALLVLKRLEQAERASDRVLGVIRGIGLSNDGRGSGILAPSVDGQVRAMQAAYEQSGLKPNDVSLIECHATGTNVGDAVELQSMFRVFRGVPDMAIGSLKSNLGHLITASGAAGVIKVLQAMRHGVRPATLNAFPATRAMEGTPFRPLEAEEPWDRNGDGPRLAAINSFGFGGNNAHLLLEEWAPSVAAVYNRRLHRATAGAKQAAVVGLAARAGNGRSTKDFISDLANGHSRIRTLSNGLRGAVADEVRLPAHGLVFPPRDLGRTLAQQNLLLEVAHEALERLKLPGVNRVSAFIGMACDAESTRAVLRLALPDLTDASRELEDAMDAPLDAARVVGCMPNIPANRLNRQFGLGGPSFTIAAEELSGIRALDIAIQALANNDIDAAVVGASDLCVEPVHCSAAGELSETKRLPGDGACVLILKRVEDAQRDQDPVWALVSMSEGGMPMPHSGDIARRVRECFGHVHAASGLIDVAAAASSLERGAMCRLNVDALGGQSATIDVIAGSTNMQPELARAFKVDAETMVYPAHPPAPSPPFPADVFVMTPAPELAPLLICRQSTVHAPATARPLVHFAAAVHAGIASAHLEHLSLMTRLDEGYQDVQTRLIRTLAGAPQQPRVTELAFTRQQIEMHASGMISTLFGEQFAAQDRYLRQVRMPEPPLLLADRVTSLTGEPGSMGRGRIVTETDVAPGSWYLHHGRMPAGLTIESGQADLMLISWLGVDALNQGKRVYRLLGCDLSFSGALPRAGETLRYDIQVDGHAAHGAVRIFFFHYDCTVNEKTRLSVRNGQAGFFTDEELASSEGVLWSAETAPPTPNVAIRTDWRETTHRSFDEEKVRAFAEGKTADCFGPGFERCLAHTRSPQIPTGRLQLLQSIDTFDPTGGPWRRGYLRAEWKVRADDWFFEGHFKNDPCMPGTVMFEGCLQAMAFYLAALGFSRERDGWRFEPVPDETYSLRCRGQVLPSSRLLQYEVFVDEIVDGALPTLYADVLCTVDGLKAFHCRRLGLRLVPDWPLEETQTERSANCPFDQTSLMACALGRPSNAFGSGFARFDGPIKVPRLPGPPYHFMSRITRAEASAAKVRSVVEAEYDVPADAWYFADNGCPVMPISVLVEILLQPCGWLASYAETWLDVQHDIFFRNLDGSGAFHSEVGPQSGVLKTRAVLTSYSQVGAMSITAFKIICTTGAQRVFDGEAIFGHFPAEALRNQTGLPPANDEVQWLDQISVEQIDLSALTGPVHLGRNKLRMIDRISGYWPDGGASGLGRLRAEKDIDPAHWFFKAHFFTDPVQPGSLGVEAVLQTLQAYMLATYNETEVAMRQPRFEPIAIGMPVNWTYRGQVLPENRRVTVLLEVVERGRDQRGVFARATASLWVDGTKIYAFPSLGMRIVDTDAEGDVEVLDPAHDTWLQDHCPTYTVPVLPMMSILDRLVAAAQRSAPRRRIVEVQNVQLTGWIAFPSGARRLKTEVFRRSADKLSVTLSVWRDAPHAAMSRYDVMATADVRLAHEYPTPPSAMPPLMDAQLVHDPPDLSIYEIGELFHGPGFQFLKKLWRTEEGSSFLLDSKLGAAPVGFLNQGLLDGITHGIPNENLRLWSDRIPADKVGYPSRILSLELFADSPADGESHCEVRFVGFHQNQERFPEFAVQLIKDGAIWAKMQLVYALFDKGPLGVASGPQRRRFLEQKVYVSGLALGNCNNNFTSVTADDVYQSDWLPGTVDTAFALQTDDRITEVAIKQHVARKAEVHPAYVKMATDLRSAQCPQYPLTVFPIDVQRDHGITTVQHAGASTLDCSAVRDYWSVISGLGEWPISDLHTGLIERFVRRVELIDPIGFAALRGKPAMFLANHQVGIESILFNVVVSALSEVVIKVIAKTEHRKSWIGQLIEISRGYPDCRQPEPTLFFDRTDPQSLIRLLNDFRAAQRDHVSSLMVHVEGTRARSCRTPVSQISSVLVDLALELDLRIIPVRFVGGLPAEPVAERLELPFEFGQQDIRIGAAIFPDALRPLPLSERSKRVIHAINQLQPEAECPLPPDESYPRREPGTNVLVEALRHARRRCFESELLLAAIDDSSKRWPADRRGAWLDRFCEWLKGKPV